MFVHFCFTVDLTFSFTSVQPLTDTHQLHGKKTSPKEQYQQTWTFRGGVQCLKYVVCCKEAPNFSVAIFISPAQQITVNVLCWYYC